MKLIIIKHIGRSMTKIYMRMIFLLKLRTALQHPYRVKWKINILTVSPFPLNNGGNLSTMEVQDSKNQSESQIKRLASSKAVTTENGPVLRHVYYMVHMGFKIQYFFVHTFSQSRFNLTTWYTGGGYAWILPYANFLRNETNILYGKKQD